MWILILANVQRYFVGGLYLPIINGVNEGIVIVMTICVISFVTMDTEGRELVTLS